MTTLEGGRGGLEGRNVMELSRHKGTGAFLERAGTGPLPVCLILTCVMLLVSMCCI